MQSIGVRELRQNASAWLARVESGESFEITNHGRSVAVLTPLRGESIPALDRLRAAGRVIEPAGDLADFLVTAAPLRSSLDTAQILDELRTEHP